jgi:hypothetical protein
MDNSRFLACTAVGTILAALVGCGGGGDGSDEPVPPIYIGSTSQAAITTTNASELTANVVTSDDSATTILGASSVSGGATRNQGSGLINVVQRLSRILRDTVLSPDQASSARRPVTAAIPVDQTDLCDGGSGSVRTSGTLNDNSTGTLAVSFNSCLVDGTTLSGPATLRVDAVASPFPSPTDYTLSFIILNLRGPGLSIDAGGTLRTQVQSGPDTETITANVVSRNNNTGETAKTENLVFIDVYPNTFIGTPVTSNVSGKVFDQVHGYVEITTPILLVFGTQTQLYPDSGQLLLTGAAGSTIRATATSSAMVQLELDPDGVGGVDNTAMLKWTDLTGPIGADLGDSDADGLHNSWETFYGPTNETDDIDLDGFNSLAEYLAGTNPNDINSHP